MKRLSIFAIIILISGCNGAICPSKTPENSTDRFSLVASTDGKVYRLDKQTGEIAIVAPDGIRIIGSSKDPLGILK